MPHGIGYKRVYRDPHAPVAKHYALTRAASRIHTLDAMFAQWIVTQGPYKSSTPFGDGFKATHASLEWRNSLDAPLGGAVQKSDVYTRALSSGTQVSLNIYTGKDVVFWASQNLGAEQSARAFSP